MEVRGLKFTVAMDADQSVGQKYGVDAIPHTVIIGPDGKVASGADRIQSRRRDGSHRHSEAPAGRSLPSRFQVIDDNLKDFCNVYLRSKNILAIAFVCTRLAKPSTGVRFSLHACPHHR